MVFDELVGKAVDRAAKERKRAARAAEAFTQLLRATRAFTPGMPWEEAHVLIASDRDYQAVRAPSLLRNPCGIGARAWKWTSVFTEKQPPSMGCDCICQAASWSDTLKPMVCNVQCAQSAIACSSLADQAERCAEHARR